VFAALAVLEAVRPGRAFPKSRAGAPKAWDEKSGFYDGASAGIPEMLIGMNVSKPRDAVRAERVSSKQVVA
jgi:hypothetical protein